MDEKQIATAVGRIRADLSTCIEAVEIMRPILFDAALLRKFDGTFSANVVNSLGDMLCRYAILSLCRMWDQAKDAQSIPRVTSFLQTMQDPTKATHQRIDQIKSVVCKMVKSKRLLRLRNWRDKNLAHALEATRRERSNGVIQDPVWGNIFDFEWRTSVIVEALTAAATDIAIHSAEDRQICSRYAQAFWGSFIDRPQ